MLVKERKKGLIGLEEVPRGGEKPPRHPPRPLFGE